MLTPGHKGLHVLTTCLLVPNIILYFVFYSTTYLPSYLPPSIPSFLSFFLKKIHFYFMCTSVLSACMYVYHVHAQCPWIPEGGIRSSGTGVPHGCEPLRGYWELSLGPLKAASGCDHKAISPVPIETVFIKADSVPFF